MAALTRLIRAATSLTLDYTADVNVVLARYVRDALAEAQLQQDSWLAAVLKSYGWQDASGFVAGSVDVRSLVSRLKALLFEGLQVRRV